MLNILLVKPSWKNDLLEDYLKKSNINNYQFVYMGMVKSSLFFTPKNQFSDIKITKYKLLACLLDLEDDLLINDIDIFTMLGGSTDNFYMDSYFYYHQHRIFTTKEINSNEDEKQIIHDLKFYNMVRSRDNVS